MSNESTLPKVFIPNSDFVWISCDILSEDYNTSGGATEGTVKKVSVEVTDPGYLDANVNEKYLEVEVDYENLVLQNTDIPTSGVEDMVSLNFLHEASILDNLRRRFQSNLPYTYVGNIICAINPYKWKRALYTEQEQEAYGQRLRHELSPHVYATSASAHRGLQFYGKEQSILVSGESGAGKTETVKILMKHLAFIAEKRSTDSFDGTIIQKVLQANPLLESFGNAKTLRNDNSSRFGKFTQMLFDEFGTLYGSRCVTYLLEKSRIVIQNEGERNYHIFHQLLASGKDIKKALHLTNCTAESFKYTMSGDTALQYIEGESDGDKFKKTLSILSLLSVSDETQHKVLQILSAILHLGSIEFEGDSDESRISDKCYSNGVVTLLCSLLGLEESHLGQMLSTRAVPNPENRAEPLIVPLGLAQAQGSCAALAKEIYEKLFLWLVRVINLSTILPSSASRKMGTISLLDIFGFESFAKNYFEQLCINFCNEKLQQKFANDFFVVIQREYQEEGLEWDKVSYVDNQAVIDLFEGSGGLISLLNEQCMRNLADTSGLDNAYLSSIVKTWGTGSNQHAHFYKTLRGMSATEFGVKHYAGDVVYDVTNMVARNKDALAQEVKTVLLGSNNTLLRDIFTDESSPQVALTTTAPKAKITGRRKSFMSAETVVMKFKSQLNALMAVIGRTEVQYVRCIKPNSMKSDKYYDRKMVVDQLRCAGMIEAIRISRAAYPYRVLRHDFVDRYGLLATLSTPEKDGGKDDLEGVISTIMTTVLPEEMHSTKGQSDKTFEIGRTKVYFVAAVLTMLETARGKSLHAYATAIQSMIRCFVCRRIYNKQKIAIVKIQSVMRLGRPRKMLNQLLREYAAGVLIQSTVRCFLCYTYYKRQRKAIILICAYVRGWLKKLRYKQMLDEEVERRQRNKQLEDMRMRLQDRQWEGDIPEDQNTTPIFVKEESVEFVKQSQKDIEALEEVQADVKRLTVLLDNALRSNEELKRSHADVTLATELKESHEKTKQLELTSKLRLEKTELMKTYFSVTEEMDELTSQLVQLKQLYAAERMMRKRQHQVTLDFLHARGVDPSILEDLTSTVAASLVNEGNKADSPNHAGFNAQTMSEYESSFLNLAQAYTNDGKDKKKTEGRSKDRERKNSKHSKDKRERDGNSASKSSRSRPKEETPVHRSNASDAAYSGDKDGKTPRTSGSTDKSRRKSSKGKSKDREGGKMSARTPYYNPHTRKYEATSSNGKTNEVRTRDTESPFVSSTPHYSHPNSLTKPFTTNSPHGDDEREEDSPFTMKGKMEQDDRLINSSYTNNHGNEWMDEAITRPATPGVDSSFEVATEHGSDDNCSDDDQDASFTANLEAEESDERFLGHLTNTSQSTPKVINLNLRKTDPRNRRGSDIGRERTRKTADGDIRVKSKSMSVLPRSDEGGKNTQDSSGWFFSLF